MEVSNETVARKPGGVPARGEIVKLVGPEPHWHPVLVRGIKLHLPVWSYESGGHVIKEGEYEKWRQYPLELAAAMGRHNWNTGDPITSPFIKELPPEPPADLSAGILSMDSVARLLGLASGRSARGFVKRHGIPFIKPGRQYLVLKANLEKFLQEHEEVAPGGGGAKKGVSAATADRLGAVTRAVRRQDAEAKNHARA